MKKSLGRTIAVPALFVCLSFPVAALAQEGRGGRGGHGRDDRSRHGQRWAPEFDPASAGAAAALIAGGGVLLARRRRS